MNLHAIIYPELIVPQQAKAGFGAGLFEFVENGAHGFDKGGDYQDGHCDPVAFTARVAERYESLYALCDLGIESPIEYQLGACLLWLEAQWLGFMEVDFLGGGPDEWKAAGLDTKGSVYITPQAKVAGYRVDFLIWFVQMGKVQGLAVECDGHQWHEKTKEQASRDKARDREILKKGFPVVRFSGSDIFKDALACKDEVQDLICGMLDPAALNV